MQVLPRGYNNIQEVWRVGAELRDVESRDSRAGRVYRGFPAGGAIPSFSHSDTGISQHASSDLRLSFLASVLQDSCTLDVFYAELTMSLCWSHIVLYSCPSGRWY